MSIDAARLKVGVEGDTEDLDKKLNSLSKRLGSFGTVARGAFSVFYGNLLTQGANVLGGLGKEALAAYSDFERLSLSLTTLTAKELVNQSAVESTVTSYRQATEAETNRAAALGRSIMMQEKNIAGMRAGSDAYNDATKVLNEMRTELGNLNITSDGWVAITTTSTSKTLSMGDALQQAGPKAQELLKWIEQLAIKSPFTQEGVAAAFKTAQVYGFTTEEAKRLTGAMIDFASGTGASEGAMNQIALALGQIKAKGKLAGQEVIQLVNAGISVDQILASSFGKSTEEIVNMREAGLIPADDAIEAIVSSLEQDFGGAAERSQNSFAGLISTMSDIKEIGLRDFFSGLFEAVQPFVSQLTDWLQGPGLDKLKEWGDKIGGFTKKIGMIGTAFVKMGPKSATFQNILKAAFGEDVAKKITPIFEAIQGLFNFIEEHKEQIITALKGIAVALAIGGIVAGVAGALALLTNPITWLVAAGAALSLAWSSDWLGIRTALTDFWVNTGQPIFSTVVQWLQTNIPLAIAAVSAWWYGTMLPALQTIWNFISVNILPVFTDIWNWLATNIPAAIQTVSDFWTGTLQPALNTVWDFISTYILPIIQDVVDIFNIGFTLATQAIADIWNNVLSPALETANKWLSEHIQPILETIRNYVANEIGPKITWFVDNVLDPFAEALKTGVLQGLTWIRDRLKELKDLLAKIKLPDWMQSHSPMPWEIGLRGVADALNDISRHKLPELRTELKTAEGVRPIGAYELARSGPTTYQTNYAAPVVNLPTTMARGEVDIEQMAYRVAEILRVSLRR